jgi:hypothetical protein
LSGTTTIVASQPQKVFTFSAISASVYGYYLTRATGGAVVAAERFSNAPYAIDDIGANVKINLAVSLIDSLD